MERLLATTSLALISAVALSPDSYAEIQEVEQISGTCWQECSYEYGKCSWCGPEHACCMKGVYREECDDTKASAEFSTCLKIEERRMLHRLINGQYSQKSIIPPKFNNDTTDLESCMLHPLINGQFSKKSITPPKLRGDVGLCVPTSVYSLSVYDDVAYAAGLDGHIYEVNMTSMDIKITQSGHTDQIRCLDASKDLLVTGSDDNTIRIWHRENMTMITELTDQTGVSACRIKENIIVTGGFWDSVLTLYDVKDSSKPNKLWVLKTHTDWDSHIDISDDFIATGRGCRELDGGVKLLNRTDGKLVRTFSVHSDSPWGSGGTCFESVRFVDNDYLISTHDDGTVRVWSVRNDTAIQTLYTAPHSSYVAVDNGLVFLWHEPISPDKLTQYYISVFVWDSKAGPNFIPDSPTKIIKINNTQVYAIRGIAATDTKIVTSGGDALMNIIDTYPHAKEVPSVLNAVQKTPAKNRTNALANDPTDP